MINFNKVRYKNFLSSGDSFTEIDLHGSKNTVIVGSNGSGKSTFCDAVTYALFDKPYRKINRPQLVNSINKKGMVVEIEFESGSKKYLIRRGQQPNLFEIYCNGELQNQKAAKKDDQIHLEKNILKMNYKSFSQIVILGSATFVPFMQLTTASRREVIEDLLDISIFSSMNNLLKDRMSEAKIVMRETKAQVENLKKMIDLQQNHISTLDRNTEELVSEKQDEVKKYSEKLQAAREKFDTLTAEVSRMKRFVNKKELVENELTRLIALEMKYNAQLTIEDKHIKFHNKNEICPTCTQNIDGDLKASRINESQDKISELEVKLAEIKNKIALLGDKKNTIEEITKRIDEQSHKIEILKSSMRQYDEYIKTSNEKIKSIQENASDVELEKNKLKKMNMKLSKLNKKYDNFVYDWDMFDVAQELLKDKGIKTQIVKQYVPIINKLVKKYLRSMNFLVDFQLDENFNETIKSRYRDIFSYESFSEGEKARIDLSLLLTWRAIAAIKNSMNTNLLILDEIFDGSVDIEGGEDFMRLLNELSDENNVFVISHRQELIDKFSSSIIFEKEKNFSRIVQ